MIIAGGHSIVEHTQIGSVCAGWCSFGHLHVWLAHTPKQSIMVEPADLDDFMVAMDGALMFRKPRPGG
jgi:hypothetical protein